MVLFKEWIIIKSFILRLFLLIILVVNSLGCSVTYYDEKEQRLHVIGFTHVQMRVPKSNSGNTVYHQVNSYGIAAGTLREGGHVSIGYSENTILDISNNQKLCFEWPSASLIEVNVKKLTPELVKGICNHVSEQKDKPD